MAYETRELTHEESAQLFNKLHISLGKEAAVHDVLRTIVDLGLGIFVATEKLADPSFLVIGQNRWGHAATLAEAKKNFRAQGGKLSSRHCVVEFFAGQAFKGVDEMGRMHWKNDNDSIPEQPKISEIEPKKAAK